MRRGTRGSSALWFLFACFSVSSLYRVESREGPTLPSCEGGGGSSVGFKGLPTYETHTMNEGHFLFFFVTFYFFLAHSRSNRENSTLRVPRAEILVDGLPPA